MTGKETSFFEQVGITTLALPMLFLLLIPSLLFRAWAVICLWNWFAVPIFTLPALNYPQAIGCILLISLFRSGNPVKDEYCDPKWQRLLIGIAGTLVAVFLGWIVKSW